MFELKDDYSENKPEFYKLLNSQLLSLLQGERDLVANLANAAALLWNALEDINWAGFYILKKGELVLGPFQGKPACIRIPLGRGVCGTAAVKGETVLVENVHIFPGHIACDSSSNSEIVIPIKCGDEVVGVIDIDSPMFSRFRGEDAAGLEEFAAILQQGCDW